MCVGYGVIKLQAWLMNQYAANSSKATGVAAFDLFSSLVNDTVTIKIQVAFPVF